MRVVHLIKANIGAKFAYLCIKELQTMGVDNWVILPASQPGKMAALYKEANIPVIDLDTDILRRNLGTFPQRLKKLKDTLNQLKPHIVNAWFFSSMTMMRLATGLKPPFIRIFTVPGPLHMEFLPTYLFDKLTFGPMDFVIPTSDYTLHLFTEKYPRLPSHRVKRIYVPLDIEKFKTERTNKLREELGISSQTPLIGMVAYMYPPKHLLGHTKGLKGHETFIDAIPLVHRIYPQARFVIIGGEWRGKGKYFSNLVKRAERIGVRNIIFFTGHRDDVPEIYPDLDIAVHPSLLSENLGGAVESLLAEVPTIASDVGGLPEAVIDGVTGLIFPRGNSSELAKRIIWMLENKEKAKKLAAEGRKRIIEMMGPRNIALQTLDFYQYCLTYGRKFLL